jgi:protein tyrosine phosphatase
MGANQMHGFWVNSFQLCREQSSDSLNGNKDVPINEFANIYREILMNRRETIKEEYKEIQSWSDGLDKTSIASASNQNFNRYSNISPFDENRVVLNDDEFENDYINASYINVSLPPSIWTLNPQLHLPSRAIDFNLFPLGTQGYHYPREYIAAQGPKPNTAHDFWRMVLQHKVESIVMLTSLIEDNKVKCHEYFPKIHGEVRLDGIRITCTIEETHPTFIKRAIVVEKVSLWLPATKLQLC